MNKKTILSLFLILICNSLFSQWKDFGIWSQITLEKKFTPRFAINLTECVRLKENASQINTHYSHLGIDFKLSQKINLVFGYRNAQKFKVDETIDYRQRFQLDFVYKLKFKQLKIELQERFQTQFTNIGRSSAGSLPEFYFRTKATLSYDLERRITPYCSAELFLNQYKYIDKLRFRLGFSYDFNKKNSLKAYYMLDKQVQQNDPLSLFALGIAYKYSF